MVNIEIYKNEHTKEIVRIKIEGHAGYGTKGNDIVCAAVSALSQTTIIGIQQFVMDGIDAYIDEGKALIDFSVVEIPDCSGHQRYQANLLLNTLELGLELIARDYSQYVMINLFLQSNQSTDVQ